MAEKRKPDFTFLLRSEGRFKNDKRKSQKIELFESTQWGERRGIRDAKKFRMRVNGKWFVDPRQGRFTYMDKWKIRDLIWRSIKL